ncbi:unnamed protein product [Pocillopora meandrina]|uniref:Uncharacterized protein n=1 Tax=Pocillopora meandrina TaxID=46732 RepID=A0AAU9X1E1_9CNID|nr:unnamed protein product [Pocillopora meandrina]
MVVKKCSELGSHLDVGKLCQICRKYDTLYDRLKRDWVKKYLIVDKVDIDKSGDEQQHEHKASSNSSDLQLSWALHKPRSEAVHFTCEVKQYWTAKFDLGERTGIKADPRKVATCMRVARNPDSSWMFERKDWPTKTQVQGFF